MTRYRDANAIDRRFVVSAWSSSYKNAHHAGIISAESWATVMHAELERYIERPGVRTIVAYDPPHQLYGFICGEAGGPMPVVHYVYVKDPYRSEDEPDGTRSGPRHARGLFAALGVDAARPFLYSCRTVMCARLADKIPLARFTPGALRYANYQTHKTHEERRR